MLYRVFFCMTLLVPLTSATTPALAGVFGDADKDDYELQQLATLVVTASRAVEPVANTTLRTQVLEGSDIERLQGQNVADALQMIPGIQLREIHGKTGKEVQIQGFSGDQVLILVNGQPVSATTGSTVDVTQLAALDVERIEVVPGAASALYGSSAMGGVVNIITGSAPTSLRLQAELGSFADDEISDASAPQRHYLASAGFQGERWHGRMSLDQRRTSETDLDTSTYASNGFGGSKTNSKIQLGREWGYGNDAPGAATLEFGHYQEDLQQRASETVNKYEDLVRRSLAGQLTQQLGHGQLKVMAQGEQQSDITLQRNRDTSLQAGLLRRNAHYRQQSLSAEWASDSMALGRHQQLKVVAGSSFAREDIHQGKQQILLGYLEDYEQYSLDGDASDGWLQMETGSYADIGNGLIESRANEVSDFSSKKEAFAQATLSLQQQQNSFDFSLGMRYQHDNGFGGHLAPTLNARQSWPLGNGLELQTRQSWGAGYRTANLKERYYIFDHSIYGYMVLGNAELKPETSTSRQLSVSLSDGRHWHLEASAFHNRITDLIGTVNSGQTDYTTGAVIYQYDNIEQAYTRGYSLASQWQLLRGLQQRASFDYLDTRNTGANLPLAGRARHNARFVWLWDASQMFDINLVAEYQGMHYSNVDDGALERSPAYWRWDLTSNVATYWSGFEQRWFAGIKNLTDSVRDGSDQYDRRPSQGRYLYAGFDFRF